VKRKLVILDLVLVIAAGAVVWRLRDDWLAARARELAVLQKQIRPTPLPPMVASPNVPPVAAASYAVIAEKMLFAKDRNPNVVVEAVAAPPKPMPALPVFYGVMNVLDDTAAIMSEKTGARHQSVRPGDNIGPFKLIAIDREEITLEWEGKDVTRKVEELIDRSTPEPPAAGNSAPRNQSGTPAPPGAAAAPAKVATAEPGVDVGNHLRACQAGDTSPPGTVSGSYKKVVTPTPFGDSCRWEPI